MTYPGDSSANSGPTRTGLPANVAGALAYVLGAITGVILYVLERENRFVRFHAAQSIVVSCVMFLLGIVLGIVGVSSDSCQSSDGSGRCCYRSASGS